MSKLPAVARGEQPQHQSKLIVRGVPPGPATEMALNLLRAPLKRFHIAQQMRVRDSVAGVDVHKAHVDLPGGARAVYTNIHGQERLEVQVSTTLAEEIERRLPRLPADPRLAIDVIFQPELYVAADVYSHIGEDTPWNDPSGWNLIRLYYDRTQYSTDDMALANHTQVTGPPGWYWLLYPFDFFWPYDRPKGPFELADLANPERPPGAIYIGRAAPVYTSAQIAIAAIYQVAGSSQQNLRDRVSYFNTVNVVGLVASPGERQYVAVSPGLDPAIEADGRLEYLDSTAEVAHTVDRALAASDPARYEFTGAGFLARPAAPVTLGSAPAPVVIDVYMASLNIAKQNDFPGTQTATVENDDPSFTYRHEGELAFTIRAREYAVATDVAMVTVETESRHERFAAPELGAGSQPTEPRLGDGSGDFDEYEPGPRTVEWGFAVGADWADQGGAPADPEAPGMGVLLADTGVIAKAVAGPEPVPREITHAPSWGGAVTDMTRVATIEWVPPAYLGATGSVTITPA